MLFDLDDRQQEQPEPQPRQIRVPFLQNEVPLGDVVKRLTEVFGTQSQPCTPCEKRRQAFNQRVILMPW